MWFWILLIFAIAIFITIKIIKPTKKELKLLEMKQLREEKEKERAAEREKIEKAIEASRKQIQTNTVEQSKPDTMTLEEMAENDCWCNNFSVPCYIAYDLETTGLNAETSEIIEIGAVKIEYHQIVDTFQELIKPKKKIPPRITEITGITNEMVENCRSIEEVLPDFLKFIEKYPMVAHNANFDYSFIKKHYMDIYGKTFSRRHYDTIKKYKQYYTGCSIKPDSCKLSDVILDILGNEYYFDIYSKDCHRALTDATSLYYIFEIINDK